MIDPDLYARAGAIFDAAVELTGDARAAALERAEREDPEAAALARRLLDHDAAGPDLGLASGAMVDDPAALLGTRIGPYTIESQIGQGGMGAVYRARRADPEDVVAIKFLTLAAAPAEAVERFRRETEWLAALDHPGIVRYRSSGVDAGRPYLVMDLLDGAPLDAESAAVRAGVRSTVEVVLAVTDAVHYLHQKGILHRDLKPSNILLAQRGGSVQPVVIDLGIARAMAAAAPAPDGPSQHAPPRVRTEPDATLGFGVVGTPAYMPPEQRSQPATQPAPPDVRGDVFALGMVLDHLLTGRAPASDATPPTTAASARVDAAAFASTGASTSTRRIDADLDAVVARALAADPSGRYSSVEALAADLRRWRDGYPVHARRAGPLGHLLRAVRRQPFAAAALFVAVAALLATAVVTRLGLIREQNTNLRLAASLDRERESRAQLERAVATTDGISEFLLDEVIGSALPERGGPDTPILTVLQSALATLEPREDSTSRILTLAVGQCVLQVYMQLQRGAEFAPLFVRLRRLAREIPPENATRIRFDLMVASLMLGQGATDAAEKIAREVWTRLEQPTGRLAQRADALAANRANAAQIIGSTLEMRDALDQAEQWFERGIEHADATPLTLVTLLNGLSYIHDKRDALDKSIAVLTRAAETIATHGGPTLGLEPAIQSNLAHKHLLQAAPTAALPHARRAVELGPSIYGDTTHPHHLQAVEHLGTCLLQTGDLPAALEQRRALVAGHETRHGEVSAETGAALRLLVETLVQADQPAAAVTVADRGIAVFEALGEPYEGTLTELRALRSQAVNATAGPDRSK